MAPLECKNEELHQQNHGTICLEGLDQVNGECKNVAVTGKQRNPECITQVLKYSHFFLFPHVLKIAS